MLRTAVLISILFALLGPSSSFSKVYMTKDEALRLAFPNAEQIEKKTVFLSEEQVKKIESIARSKLKSKLYIFYLGKKEGKTLGYAVIDTHLLRTVTETIMVVINPDGTLRQVEILAFFEPPDYMPGDSWINLFRSKTLNDSLRIGRGIPNITGATITSNAIVEAVRRIMAVFDVAVRGNN
jgi:Na+-translocating ferredoxin:NAD+ oxidoreductase RnfG subunit